jgi:thymidylate synthase
VTGLENHTMGKYFEGVTHGEFIRSVLTIDQINTIVEVYKENGASREAIANELEAFAVAVITSPDVIAQQLETLCLSE